MVGLAGMRSHGKRLFICLNQNQPVEESHFQKVVRKSHRFADFRAGNGLRHTLVQHYGSATVLCNQLAARHNLGSQGNLYGLAWTEQPPPVHLKSTDPSLFLPPTPLVPPAQAHLANQWLHPPCRVPPLPYFKSVRRVRDLFA